MPRVRRVPAGTVEVDRFWRTAPAREVLRLWLQDLAFIGWDHASRLVTKVADVWPADASWLAEQWIRKLVEAGWLERDARPTPSEQQAFTGVGGMTGRAIMKSPEWAPLSVFGYSAKDRAAILAWLRSVA